NGTTGIAGFRTDDYLYLPIGVTARTVVGAHRGLSFNLEYDQLLHGWQHTHDSQLGGGDVPATLLAPAFTIDGFSDIQFSQQSGGGLPAGWTDQVTRHWWVPPEFTHWTVSASPDSFETAPFTVNGISAAQQLGAYEPLNRTNEFVTRVGFRF